MLRGQRHYFCVIPCWHRGIRITRSTCTGRSRGKYALLCTYASSGDLRVLLTYHHRPCIHCLIGNKCVARLLDTTTPLLCSFRVVVFCSAMADRGNIAVDTIDADVFRFSVEHRVQGTFWLARRSRSRRCLSRYLHQHYDKTYATHSSTRAGWPTNKSWMYMAYEGLSHFVFYNCHTATLLVHNTTIRQMCASRLATNFSLSSTLSYTPCIVCRKVTCCMSVTSCNYWCVHICEKGKLLRAERHASRLRRQCHVRLRICSWSSVSNSPSARCFYAVWPWDNVGIDLSHFCSFAIPALHQNYSQHHQKPHLQTTEHYWQN